MILDSFLDRRTVLTAGSALMFGAALSPWELRAQTSGGKLPIGTIGAGQIGSTIGGLWVENGHKVLFSSRHPEELKDLVSGLGPLAHVPIAQCPLYPQKRTLIERVGMSALCQ